MNGESDDRELSTVPLQRAVFCVDCETVSNSQHDVCTVCGSPSLISLVRLLGGTIQNRNAKALTVERHGTVKYNLELTVKAYAIAARDLNHAIESITQLADVAGNLECLHLNVESVELPTVKLGPLKAAA
jgi:hypothetical protein